MRTLLLAALAVAGCFTHAPPDAPPPLAARAPAPPAMHAVVLSGVSTNVTQAEFVAPGRLLIATQDTLALVDTFQHKQIGDARVLNSEIVDDPRDPANHRIDRRLGNGWWTWDRDQLAGVVLVGGFGGADPRGLGVWRPGSERTPRFQLARYGYNCRAFAFRPDLARFATFACDDTDGMGGGLQVFAPGAAAPIAQVPSAGHAALSPDGARIAFSDAANDISILDIASGKVTKLPHALAGSVISLAFHPTRPLLVTTGTDGTYIWDLARGGSSQRLTVDGDAAAFGPDGRLALHVPTKVVLLDATNWHVTAELPIDYAGSYALLAWSPDAHQLAVVTGGSADVFDLAPTAPHTIDDAWWSRIGRLPAPAPAEPPPIGHDGVVTGTLTANGKPVPGIEIALVPSKDEWPDARALTGPTAKTGADGTFRLANVPQIDWGVIIAPSGYVRSGFLVDMRKRATVDIQLELEPAVTISGRVLGPDGKPAANVRIVHYNYDGTIDLDQRTGKDGAFVVDHLRPTTLKYDVGFRRDDGAVRWHTFDITKPARIPATIKLLAVTDPHVVRLHVLDKNGNPARDVDAILNESRSFPTDANGDTSFEEPTLKRVPLRVRGLGGGVGPVDAALPQTAPLEVKIAP